MVKSFLINVFNSLVPGSYEATARNPPGLQQKWHEHRPSPAKPMASGVANAVVSGLPTVRSPKAKLTSIATWLDAWAEETSHGFKKPCCRPRPPFSLEHPNRPEIMNASLPQVSERYAGMRAVMTMRKLFEKMMRFQMGIAQHPALRMSNECQLLGDDLLACPEQYTHSARSN